MSRVLRKRARVCYYEPEEPSFDEYIYCTSCGDYVYEYCSIHGPLLVVPDDKVPTPTGYPSLVPRAALTVPKVFLHLAASHIPGAEIGVFSTLTLPAGVRFGPYRGARTQRAAGSVYCWQIYDREHRPSHLVDARDANKSNWMRYVNCSRDFGEQNLVAYQYRGQIYYRTIKMVPRFTELLVYYGSEFALELDVNLSRYHVPRARALELHRFAQDRNRSEDGEPIIILSKKETVKSHTVTDEILSSEDQDNVPRILNENSAEDTVCVNTKRVDNSNSNGSKLVPHNSFICNECGKGFKEKASLIYHISTHNIVKTVKTSASASTILKFPCTSCDSKFVTKVELINHDIKVHDSKIKYKACDYCDFKTVNSHKLTRHVRTHTGEKPYQCTVCESKFGYNDSLKRHLRIHTDEKPYQCTICGSKFIDIRRLKRHSRTHTGEKPYQCTICDSKFTESGSLRKHLRIHTGEKPYQCTICGSKFIEIRRLKRHSRTHTGEKPYQCTICGSKFTESGSLKKHLRLHTGA